MKRFAQLNGHPGILRGSAPTPQEVKYLYDVWKVKRIVSLDQQAGNAIAKTCQQLGIHQIFFPLEITEVVSATIQALKNKIRDLLDTEQPVFIHCQHGEDRTGLAIALYRVATGWDCQTALREARQFGFGDNLSAMARNVFESAICGGQVPTTPTTAPQPPTAPTTITASLNVMAEDPKMDAASIVRNQFSDQVQTAPDLHRSFFGDVATVSRDQFYPISTTEDPPAQESFHRPQQPTEGYYSTHYDEARADDKARKKNKKRNKRRKRRMKIMSLLLDRNDAFPEIGAFRDCNPIFRTLGPIDSGGLKPGNISYNY